MDEQVANGRGPVAPFIVRQISISSTRERKRGSPAGLRFCGSAVLLKQEMLRRIYALCILCISTRRIPGKLLCMVHALAALVGKKRITFELPEETHRRLRLLCFTDGYTIGEVLTQLVQDFCEHKEADMIQIIDNRRRK